MSQEKLFLGSVMSLEKLLVSSEVLPRKCDVTKEIVT